MKKLILVIGLLSSFGSNSLFAQNMVDTVLQIPHFYHIGPPSFLLEKSMKMHNNTYVKWVSVDSIGFFHSSAKRIEQTAPDRKLEPWDSLYLTNQGRLTFYFRESFYKELDTLILAEMYDNMHDRIACVSGVFINGIKESIWKKTIFAPIDGEYDSRIVVEETYKNGLLHGERNIYQLNGKELNGTIFVNGTGDYYGYYYDSGKFAVRGFLVYGKRHGKWTYYNKEGSVIKEERYKHGLLHGPFTIYDPSGNIIYETIFHDGNGEYRLYKDGVLKMAGQMVNGKRSGKWDFTVIVFKSNGEDLGKWKYEIIYEENDLDNDPANIIDEMFYEGEFLYLRATRDEKGKSTD